MFAKWRDLPWKVIGVVVVMAGLALGTLFALNTFAESNKQAGRDEVMALWAKDSLKRSVELTKAKDEIIQTESRYKDLIAKASDDHAERLRQIDRHYDLSRASVVRLRDALADARARLSKASGDSLAATVEYATALSIVFGECTERYTAVAKKAGQHAADAEALNAAWPRKQKVPDVENRP